MIKEYFVSYHLFSPFFKPSNVNKINSNDLYISFLKKRKRKDQTGFGKGIFCQCYNILVVHFDKGEREVLDHCVDNIIIRVNTFKGRRSNKSLPLNFLEA